MQIKRFLGNFAKAYLAIGALSVSAYAVADDWNCAPDCAPQQCCPTLCCDVPCHEAPNCAQGYNPSAYYNCGGNDCCFMDNLRFEVDFLWWRASSDLIELGYEETFNPSTTPTSGVLASNAKQALSARLPKERFEPGFRIGLDYVCPCDGWDAGLFYTHFHSKASTSASSFFPTVATDTRVVFRPLWETVAASVPDAARGEWILNLDYLDLEIGHKYYVSCRFILRPFIGLRGARINQSYNYDAFASRTGGLDIGQSSNTFTSTLKAKNNFLGAGPRVGLDIQFDIGCGFSIFGEAAGSILYGRFERHSNELYTDTSGAAGAPGTTYRFNQHWPSDRTSTSISDVAIGLQYDRCFCWCGKSHPFSLAISWEHHGFYDLAGFGVQDETVLYDTVGGTANFPTSNGAAVSRRARGDFFTQGLTVSANFGF